LNLPGLGAENLIAGWGAVPFTANGVGWLTVYVIAPILGAIVGGGVHRLLLSPHYRAAP
jgi:glycerol uptake facilitator protein